MVNPRTTPSLSRRRVSGQAAIFRSEGFGRFRHGNKFLSFPTIRRRRIDFRDSILLSLNRKHRPFATPANFLTKTDRTHQTRPRELQHPIWPYCCRQDARTSDISSSVRERTRLDEKKRSNPADKCLISPFPSTSTSAASKRGAKHAMEKRPMNRRTGIVQRQRLKAIRHQRDIRNLA